MIEHRSVMVDEVKRQFAPLPAGATLCDATCGAGGHSAALLELCPSCTVVAVDADARMLEIARARLTAVANRCELVHAWFDEFFSRTDVRHGFDRILFDLGVSMVHMRTAEAGFSLTLDGPLDMRLDQSTPGRGAADLVAQLREDELADLIFRYGEDRNARRIARAIVRRRAEAAIRTTAALADVVRAATPPAKRYGRLHPATRTFQALRIAVNDELGRIERALPLAARALRPGGRLAVISFHSLEDRIAKGVFRSLSGANDQPMVDSGEPRFRVVTRKPLIPTTEEIRMNGAARSAKMRVLERIDGLIAEKEWQR